MEMCDYIDQLKKDKITNIFKRNRDYNLLIDILEMISTSIYNKSPISIDHSSDSINHMVSVITRIEQIQNHATKLKDTYTKYGDVDPERNWPI